jgi:putative ABC transport system permease protein
MLAISIGLILAMLVARTSVNAKVAEVKATTATGITINPAGIQGGMGGGDPLTAEQVKTITDTAHVSSVVSTLTDQLGTDDTNLTPSFELGSFGKRQMRFESGTRPATDTPSTQSSGDTPAIGKMPAPRTSVTGTTDSTGVVAQDKLTSGSMIDGGSSDATALVGKALADKNSLSVGSTFTAYGKTITIKGIFSVDNTFENNGIIMPLSTVQTLTSQPGAVSSISATADSSENVATTVAALKTALGDKADITSQQEQAASSVQPLESIASLATAGVIAASLAGAVIILLSMIMIVRERRREIGVIKAIGGTNFKVITQFITEALTLTIIGGVIGLALGIAVSGPMTQSLVAGSQASPTSAKASGRGNGSATIQRASGNGLRSIGGRLGTSVQTVSSTLTPTTFIGSIGLILLIAIVGSAVPAWAIARVRPAEVLRTE